MKITGEFSDKIKVAIKIANGYKKYEEIPQDMPHPQICSSH